ncbi:hypothetical protein HBB16_08530 [Pseudonocardia sp. MCCB 268]|nr:hypothetical protein [Pseudonocardia cytotoxica]
MIGPVGPEHRPTRAVSRWRSSCRCRCRRRAPCGTSGPRHRGCWPGSSGQAATAGSGATSAGGAWNAVDAGRRPTGARAPAPRALPRLPQRPGSYARDDKTIDLAACAGRQLWSLQLAADAGRWSTIAPAQAPGCGDAGSGCRAPTRRHSRYRAGLAGHRSPAWPRRDHGSVPVTFLSAEDARRGVRVAARSGQ